MTYIESFKKSIFRQITTSDLLERKLLRPSLTMKKDFFNHLTSKRKKKNSNLEKGLWGKKEGANRDLNLVDWPHFLLVKMASSKIFPSPFSSACQLVKFKRESTNLPKVCTFGDVYSFLKLMMRKHKVLCQVETAATFHISKNHTVGTQGLLSLLSYALYLNNSNGTLCRVFTSKVYWAC